MIKSGKTVVKTTSRKDNETKTVSNIIKNDPEIFENTWITVIIFFVQRMTLKKSGSILWMY